MDRKGRVPIRVACVSATVGGCVGVVTLAGRIARGEQAVRVGLARLGLKPGDRRRVRVRLTRPARRAVRRRHRIRMTLYTATRDAQGVTRTSAAPVAITSRRRGR
jgi:hypothetical protein